ncbi:MAG: glycine reductase [Caloramator sp.]|jgi:betaine reductase|uniref:glycine/sarcosine/betaine reductase complex component C subunit alpha n=1 Tax=Caloramator sp. TaxID=1871330 RepID=UPI001D7A99E1|nr:glycine/sarcosine/betaine reductase complex component C subunit alpha [Caloramator sp.]MBZ4662990.1 glycine reductase [Caloramator sp.]
MSQNIKKIVAEVLNDIADILQNGYAEEKIKIGLTTLGSELGEEEIIKAAYLAKNKYSDFEVVLIGPSEVEGFSCIKAESEDECHKIMEKLIDEKVLKGCVTMHYNFPIGVSTVGRIITPSMGKEVFIATTTGTSSSDRIEAMVKNTFYGVIAAKACGIKKPTVGILNVEGARQVEKILIELKNTGYDIEFCSSIRKDGGFILRGNDILAGSADVVVTDSLTGNVLMKIFSAYTTGGDYESLGYGYGPGIGEGYKRLINIISRASGAPVICEALRYCATCAKNEINKILEDEFKKLEAVNLKYIFEKLKKVNGKSTEDVKCPNKKVVTSTISGIDILELENAVKMLWAKGIYAESGMGCTGPIVMVADEDLDIAMKILKECNLI